MYYVNLRVDSRHHQRFVLVIKVNSEWGRGVIESSVKGRGHDTMVIVDINTYSGNLAYTVLQSTLSLSFCRISGRV